MQNRKHESKKPVETKPTGEKITRITKEELQSKATRGAQIVNVLDPKYYSFGSIKGSMKIPVSELPNRLSELDKDSEVVTYCLGQECTASIEGAKILQRSGFDVTVYEGGIKEWKAAALPLEDDGVSGEYSEDASKKMNPNRKSA